MFYTTKQSWKPRHCGPAADREVIFFSSPHYILIRIYLLHSGDSFSQFQIVLYCILATSPSLSFLLKHLPTQLETIITCFIVLFHISVYSTSTIFSHLNHLYSTSPFPQVPPPHTVPFLKSCVLLLIPKSMFKGFSQCNPIVSKLYFGPFNPFHNSPLPFPSHHPLFNSFQYIQLCPLPSQMLYIIDTLFLFLLP
jgi:hypothetical protein